VDARDVTTVLYSKGNSDFVVFSQVVVFSFHEFVDFS
jgi:hypothetical protein